MTILTDELVEKAARAYTAAWKYDIETYLYGWTTFKPPSFDQMEPYQRAAMCRCARAALSAVLPGVIAAERERCAKVAEDFIAAVAPDIAAAIRKGD